MISRQSSILLMIPIACTAAALISACDTSNQAPPTAGDQQNFFGVTLDGVGTQVKIDAKGALTMTLKQGKTGPVWEDLGSLTGTCTASATTAQIMNCKVESVTGAIPSPKVGDLVRFIHLKDSVSSMELINEADIASAPTTYLNKPDQFFHVNQTCKTSGGSSTGDGYETITGGMAPVGEFFIDMATSVFRHAEFALKTSGSSFVSEYATTTSGGSGEETLNSFKCFDGLELIGHGTGGGIGKMLPRARLTSGASVSMNFTVGVPVEIAVTNATLAGRHFQGLQVDGAGNVPIKFDITANGVGAEISNFTTPSGAPTIHAIDGLVFMPLNSSALGAKFAAAIPAINAISSKYPKASSVPGLSAAIELDGSFNELTSIMTAWKAPSGKIAIFIGHYDVSSAVLSLSTGTLAVEE